MGLLAGQVPGLEGLDEEETDLEDGGNGAVDQVPAPEEVRRVQLSQELGATEVGGPVTVPVQSRQRSIGHLEYSLFGER